MGEFYRANDTRLDRGVAIKVLPAHVASNLERYLDVAPHGQRISIVERRSRSDVERDPASRSR